MCVHTIYDVWLHKRIKYGQMKRRHKADMKKVRPMYGITMEVGTALIIQIGGGR